MLPNNSLFPYPCRTMWKIFLACSLLLTLSWLEESFYTLPQFQSALSQDLVPEPLGWELGQLEMCIRGSVSRIHRRQSRLPLTDFSFHPGCFSLLTKSGKRKGSESRKPVIHSRCCLCVDQADLEGTTHPPVFLLDVSLILRPILFPFTEPQAFLPTSSF